MVDRVRVREVYLEAAECSEESRAALLDQLCAGDGQLRAEVESLLRAAANRPQFLASPTSDAAGPTSEVCGTRIGPYRLLQEIGQGGFGSVYMAEQEEPVRRRVALKIIKLGMDTRAVIARFEAERQALAIMDHVNIARVFDAGATESGRPYFVMELVRGDPITIYCDRHSLDITARLGLFLQVCHAVQHAHSKGVIHRDIKPGNVLVATEDGRPFAKVIDFGIAKAVERSLTEKTVFTEFRQFVGTPEYKSPEQAGGSLHVDTRSDIYSLGVLLYELLTGTTPVDPTTLRAAAYEEIQRIIREVEPAKPSTRLSRSTSLDVVATARGTEARRLGALLRGDLDWIVMRALEKDRARRYETASELAADIGRHLAGEPVLAAPPSFAYRASRFVRRHRTGVVAASLVLASLVLGLGGSLWQAAVARRERDSARFASAEADLRRKDLEQVAAFQESQLAGVDVELMGRRLLDAVMADAKESMGRRGVSQEQIAERLSHLRELLRDVNLTDVSLQSLDQNIFEGALKGIDEHFGEQPLVRARLLQAVAFTLTRLGLFERAVRPQADALDIRRRLLGDQHADTISSLASSAELFLERGKLPEAEQHAREVVDTLKRALSSDDSAIGAARSVLGGTLLAQGRASEAEAHFYASLEAWRRARGNNDPQTLVALQNLGGVFMEMGRYQEAESHFRQAFDGLRRVTGEQSRESIQAAANLGFSLERQGRLAEAEPLYRETLAKRQLMLGEDHPSTILAMNNLAWLEDELAQHTSAEAHYVEAIARARRTLGDKHIMTLRYIGNFGQFLRSRGRATESESRYREAVAGLEPQLGAGHALVAVCNAGLGGALLDQNRFEEAEPALNAGAKAFAGMSGGTNAEHRKCVEDLVALYERWNARTPGRNLDSKAAEWRAAIEKLTR